MSSISPAYLPLESLISSRVEKQNHADIALFPLALLTLSCSCSGGGVDHSDERSGIHNPMISVLLIDLQWISSSTHSFRLTASNASSLFGSPWRIHSIVFISSLTAPLIPSSWSSAYLSSHLVFSSPPTLQIEGELFPALPIKAGKCRCTSLPRPLSLLSGSVVPKWRCCLTYWELAVWGAGRWLVGMVRSVLGKSGSSVSVSVNSVTASVNRMLQAISSVDTRGTCRLSRRCIVMEGGKMTPPPLGPRTSGECWCTIGYLALKCYTA